LKSDSRLTAAQARAIVELVRAEQATAGWGNIVSTSARFTVGQLFLQMALLVGVLDLSVHAQRLMPAPIPLADGLADPDPAAAKAGYLYVKDGHLHRNGRRIRLWGMNIVQEYRQDKKAQIQTLDRIKALGFNALRLHLYDDVLVASGTGFDLQTYVKGDDSEMDRLDHFIAAAIDRGLVLYMTLDRFRRPIRPEAYSILPPDGQKTQWKEAVQHLMDEQRTGSAKGQHIEHVWPIDPRMEAAYTRYCVNLVSHRNAYTGRTYAEEPAIGLWEVSNESTFITDAMKDELSTPRYNPYWRDKARELWNEFLRQNYQTDEMLRAAWGTVAPTESLKKGTIQLEPLPISNDMTRDRRAADLATFFVNRYVEANNRLLTKLRTLSSPGRGIAIVPVGYDTHFTLDLLNLYCASRGGFSCTGTYKWLRSHNKANPLYPFDAMVANTPDLSGMNVGRILNKPMVTYEVNIMKPAPYRAEFPLLVAALTSAQDWDAVFWYHWLPAGVAEITKSEQLFNNRLRYASMSDHWGGVPIFSDLLLIASLRVAGELFLRSGVRPAPDPVRFEIGRSDLLDTGRNLAEKMRVASYTTGMRASFTPNAAQSHLSRPVAEQFPPAQVKVGSDMLHTYGKRRVTIDSPTTVALIGWPDTGDWRTSSGHVRLSRLDPKLFIACAVVAADGKTIQESRRLVITAQRTGENTGFAFDPTKTTATDFDSLREAVVNPGDSPQQIKWPQVVVHLPNAGRAIARHYDAVPGLIHETPVNGEVLFDGQRPTAWVEVTYED
jgi:hypothetical protein